MKKLLVLTFAFWAGLSNFAYASARVYCADMAASDSTPSCHGQSEAQAHSCKDVPCECKIEKRAEDRSVPPDSIVPTNPDKTVWLLDRVDSASARIFSDQHSDPIIFPSPPIYQLHSVYRI